MAGFEAGFDVLPEPEFVHCGALEVVEVLEFKILVFFDGVEVDQLSLNLEIKQTPSDRLLGLLGRRDAQIRGHVLGQGHAAGPCDLDNRTV